MKAHVLIAASALLVAGCSSGATEGASAPTPVPAPPTAWTEADGPATWTCTSTGGAVYTISLPVKMDDPKIQKVEAYRMKVKADPVAYLPVTVDATNAQKKESIWDIEWATASQQSRTSDNKFWTDWQNKSSASDPLYGEGIETEKSIQDMPNPGAKGYYLTATPGGKIDSMISPSIFDGASRAPCVRQG